MCINRSIKELSDKLCHQMDENVNLLIKITGDKMPNYSSLEKTIISQQKTIEQLTKALCDKCEINPIVENNIERGA